MTKEEMQEMLSASEERISLMIDAKLKATESRLENALSAEMKAVHKKLDRLQFQMDTVYNWVDGLDLDVRMLKKEA